MNFSTKIKSRPFLSGISLFMAYATFFTLMLGSCLNSDEQDAEGSSIPTEQLTENEALKILQEDYRGSQCSCSIWRNGNDDQAGYSNTMRFVKELNNDSLIEYRSDYRYNTEYTELTLTARAVLRYDHNQYRVAVTEVFATEIIGIAHFDDNNRASVLFSATLKETPFYPLGTEEGLKSCPLGGEIVKEATFIKYNTGWRLIQ